jgi:metal-sulfur cluster biosynthetic enzyme/nitrite reductase/ring-hydroxylating ferredoxin subunit
MMSAVWELVAELSELAETGRKSIFVNDTPALLVRQGEQLYVVEDVCSHDGQPLTDGEVTQGQIECPRHGARFSLATGAAVCMPATEAIRTFAVAVRDGQVFVSEQPTGAVMDAVTSPPAATASTPAGSSGSPAGAPLGATASLSASSTLPAAGSTAADLLPKTDVAGAATDHASSPSTTAEVDDGDLVEALRQVIDPELMINIVDLGLVYGINQTDRRVHVEMTLTSPACPAGPQIVSQAKSVLERIPGIDEAKIQLVMSPPWTPERMTDEARDQLGIF